jgi:hypothetical protein
MTPSHINQLTDEQVAAHTPDELDRITRRMMAEAGLAIVPTPIEPEYEPEPKPDATVYQIAGVTFISRDAAETVMTAINDNHNARVQLRHDYSVGYNRHCVEFSEDLETVTTKQSFSQDTWAQHHAVMERNEAKRKQYEADKAAHRKATEAARSVVDTVRDRYAEVVERFADLDRLAARFAEYVEIADGDRWMALQFLRKVEHIADDDLPRVCGGDVPPDPADTTESES